MENYELRDDMFTSTSIEYGQLLSYTKILKETVESVRKRDEIVTNKEKRMRKIVFVTASISTAIGVVVGYRLGSVI